MTGLTCREMLDFVSDYLDGQLPSETARVFDQHLTKCPECVAYLANFKTTLAASRRAFAADAVPPPIPEELVQAILASRASRGT